MANFSHKTEIIADKNLLMKPLSAFKLLKAILDPLKTGFLR